MMAREKILRWSTIVCLFLAAQQNSFANINDPRFAARWDSLKTLCGKAFFYGNLNDAAQHAESLYQLSLQGGNDSLSCLALMIKSTVINDPAKATQAFEDAIKAAERFGNLKMIVTVKSNFAINRFTIGDIRRAYIITREIQALADSLNMDLAREQASLNFGQIYDYIGDSRKSIAYLKALIQLLPKGDYDNSLLKMRTAQAYAGIARGYSKLNQTDSADIYIRKAIAIAHEEQISDILLRGYLELAALYGKNNPPSAADLQAMRTALDSAASNQQGRDWMLLNRLKVTEAKYLLLSGQAEQCISMVGHLLPEVEKAGDLESLRNFRELLSDAYSSLKRYEPAFENLQALAILNDSIARNELSGKLALYEVDKQTKEKELENSELRRKNELALQRARLMMIGGLIAAILAILALVFARRSYLQARKNELLNTKLVHINGRLERFVSSVSHDILSNIDLMLTWGRLIETSRSASLSYESYYKQAHLIHAQLKEYCLGLLRESRTSVNAVDSYYDPAEIIKKVLQRFETALDEAGFKIQMETLSFVQIPPVIIEQLFQNLISNTLRYGRGASAPMIRIAEEQDSLKRKYWIVEDNGPGIREEQLKTLFEQVEKESSKGQGLGLSLLKSNLMEYGWDIRAETRVGGGARFVIALN